MPHVGFQKAQARACLACHHGGRPRSGIEVDCHDAMLQPRPSLDHNLASRAVNHLNGMMIQVEMR
jgi:hypothetical protein